MIIECEAAAKLSGMPIAKLCRQMKVNRATWQRWKAGHYAPRLHAFDRLRLLHAKMTANS